jgi:hypothetical protein
VNRFGGPDPRTFESSSLWDPVTPTGEGPNTWLPSTPTPKPATTRPPAAPPPSTPSAGEPPSVAGRPGPSATPEPTPTGSASSGSDPDETAGDDGFGWPEFEDADTTAPSPGQARSSRPEPAAAQHPSGTQAGPKASDQGDDNRSRSPEPAQN